MNQEINKYYFDIDNKANYIFFECKNGLHYMLSNSICSYIPELPPNAREYPNKWNSQKWNKCGKKWISFFINYIVRITHLDPPLLQNLLLIYCY